MERKYNEIASMAIQDRARIFLEDDKVGTSRGVPTILQGNKERIRFMIRSQNRGRGLTDYQLDYMKGICHVYDAIVGINQGYTPELLERVNNHLFSSHEIIDEHKSKDRSYINKRSLARARKDIVLEGNEYFWNLHLYPTQDLIVGLCRIRNGEPEERVWRNCDTEFDSKIRSGELNPGDLAELLNERNYLFYRTFVNSNTHI